MRTIVLDTDPGVDDTLALLYLHRRPDVAFAGITTVAGNATIDIVTRNALYLAERLGIDAPVARGAATSLHGISHIAPPQIHGTNGLGDIAFDAPTRALDPRPAHRFIIDTVRARPGEITILALGRLTNLARALIDDPAIAACVRDVIIMGGAFGIGEHYGNVSPIAEANIYGDPHAADIVSSAPWPVTFIGLDVTERVLMTESYLERFRSGDADARLVWEVTRGYQAFHVSRDGLAGIYCHDPCAAICTVDDSPFTFRELPVRVVSDGIAAGMTLQRGRSREGVASAWDDVRPQRVAIDVDATTVLERFAAPFF